MRYEPVNNLVLVSYKRDEDEKVTDGGIIVTTTAENKPRYRVGVVEEVGRGHVQNGTVVPLAVKKGDVVWFSRFECLTEDKLASPPWVLLDESKVYMIIHKDES